MYITPVTGYVTIKDETIKTIKVYLERTITAMVLPTSPAPPTSITKIVMQRENWNSVTL